MNTLKISRVPLVGNGNAYQTTGMSTRIASRTRREWLQLPLIAGALISMTGCVWTDLATKAGSLSGLSGMPSSSHDIVQSMTAQGYTYQVVPKYKGAICDIGDISCDFIWSKTATGAAAIDTLTPSTASTNAIIQPTLTNGAETAEEAATLDALAPIIDAALAKKKTK